MVNRKKTHTKKFILLERELKRFVERIFEEKKRKMGIDNVILQIDVITEGWGPPITDENVYAEAFPFENPPRIWIQVWPDAMNKEIAEIICHELIHIKRPELNEKSVETRTHLHKRWGYLSKNQN